MPRFLRSGLSRTLPAAVMVTVAHNFACYPSLRLMFSVTKPDSEIQLSLSSESEFQVVVTLTLPLTR